MNPTELKRATHDRRSGGGARNRAVPFLKSTFAISTAFVAFLILFLGCSLLRASHPRLDTSSHPAISKNATTAGPFGEIVRGPRGKSEIALTFDAGADADCFDDLIVALANAHVHSTFFVTGKFAQQHRDCAAEITKRAHEVGNHTWNHLNLTQQPDNIVREEISRAEIILNDSCGQDPKPRWRAPYGERDERVLRIATSLGYRSIYWTLDSLDGVEPIKTPLFLINRVTLKSDEELDGAIILMHVGVRSTADALPTIIANLQGRGFHLVTVSELLRSSVKTP